MASRCHSKFATNSLLEGSVTVNIRTIGLDLAKNVFQVHGVDAQGKVVLRKQRGLCVIGGVLCQPAALSGRDGGVCQPALLGPQAGGTGARRQADGAPAYEAVCH